MPVRRTRPVAFRAKGLSDTFDATNIAMGAMAQMANLIPAPQAKDSWVSRPASTSLYAFGDFTTPVAGEALFTQGTRVYGMIQSARNSGKSEPFIYDTNAAAIVVVAGVTSANTPTSTSNSGEWTPPTMDQIGSRILVTHPGFDGTTHFFGWFDMSGFSSNTLTGSTHTSTTVDTLSSDVIAAGWRPGMTITGTDIPANTTIVSINSAGTSITISNTATGSSAGVTFTVAGGTFAAPLWCSGNTLKNALAAVPVAVAQYAGSACFGVNTTSPPSAGVTFSDAGDPLLVTNASQVVTVKNAIPITALKGMPLNSLSGGIIASLIAFQGTTAMQQITGTIAGSNLAVNQLLADTGTDAANSIAITPKGMIFADRDGLRVIDFSGNVSDVIGRRGTGISMPFLFASTPSRMAASYHEGVYRISVKNGAVVGTPTQEYWLHLDDGVWSGPHTFPAALIVPDPKTSHSFIMFASGINAKLWTSNAYTTLSATFVENGTQMTFAWQTSLLPDTLQMSENALNETVISIAVPAQQTVTATFSNENNQTIGLAVVGGTGTAAALWGTMLWGVGIWGGGIGTYQQRQIPWPAPMVFKQGQLLLTGNCAQAIKIGNLYMSYEQLGYLLPSNVTI